MNPLHQTVVLLCMFLLVGCKSAPKDTSDMDAILNTVVYDTSVPVIPASYRDPGEYSPPPTTDTPAADTKPIASKTFTDRARSAGAFVGHGLRATVGLLLVGTFKIVETSLGLNDSTPRGRNDTAFNQWLDDRDRWRRED